MKRYKIDLIAAVLWLFSLAEFMLGEMEGYYDAIYAGLYMLGLAIFVQVLEREEK